MFPLKVFAVPNDIETLIENASKKFDVKGKKLYTVKGAEIDDTYLIRDDETLYLCISGEAFSSKDSQPINHCDEEKNTQIFELRSSEKKKSNLYATLILYLFQKL